MHELEKHSSGDVTITAYAQARIDFEVRKFGNSFSLSEDDRDDLRQDMALELCQSLKRFDPNKGTYESFVDRVIDQFACVSTRIGVRRYERDFESADLLDEIFIGFEPLVGDVRQGELDEQAMHELCMDVNMVIASLPETDQHLCREMMRCTPQEAAERLGMNRNNFLIALARIRKRFEDSGLAPEGIISQDFSDNI